MLTYRFLPLSRPLSGFLGALVIVQQVARVRVKNYTQLKKAKLIDNSLRLKHLRGGYNALMIIT